MKKLGEITLINNRILSTETYSNIEFSLLGLNL